MVTIIIINNSNNNYYYCNYYYYYFDEDDDDNDDDDIDDFDYGFNKYNHKRTANTSFICETASLNLANTSSTLCCRPNRADSEDSSNSDANLKSSM